MSDNGFYRALREAVSAEFADIPSQESEIRHTFSDVFSRKMNKLIRSEKNKLWKIVSTVPKKVAVVIVSILTITLAACSIPSVRAAVVDFVKEIYDSCIRLFTNETGVDSITDHYGLKSIPEGFVEVNTFDNDTSFVVIYQNKEDEEIILSQSITDDYWIDIDTENGTIFETEISGKKVTVYETDGCMVAVWVQDGYAFNLTIYADCDRELITELVDAVQRK